MHSLPCQGGFSQSDHPVFFVTVRLLPETRPALDQVPAQVHPDKCSCFGAESAFQLISKASTKLQAQIDEGLVGEDYTEPHSPDAASDPAADWTMPMLLGSQSLHRPRVLCIASMSLQAPAAPAVKG